MRLLITTIVLATLLLTRAYVVEAKDYDGDPGNYTSKLRQLKPGDTLRLKSGTYPNGLPIKGMHGKQGTHIIVTGPEQGAPALFTGKGGRDTIEIYGSSFITVRNLELDGKNLPVNGVNARKTGGMVHDITIENLIIRNHGPNQQIVGISTNQSPTWNWIIRNNVIDGAGTGMYLGNSDGRNPFVNGVIEHNLIMNTIGYNCQIKHQIERPADMPAEGTTIIRHNVFCKQKQPPGRSDGARPNLLVGHQMKSGTGSKDKILIYGNFFYENPTEALFQGESNIAIYNNLFVNTRGMALRVGRHNGSPRMIRVFNNTVVATGAGIRVGGGDQGYKQIVFGNAVFASGSIGGPQQFDNITGSYQDAAKYLAKPHAAPGQLDLFPLPGKLKGKAIDTTEMKPFVHWNVDFNGSKRSGSFRGAYAREGANPGWLPQLERKPAKSPYEIMAGDGPYTKLASLAAQIKTGKNLGRALKTVRGKLTSTNPEEAAEAKLMFESLGGEAQRRFDEAKALVEKDPFAAMTRFEKVASMFTGDDIGTNAKQEASKLKTNPKIRNETMAASWMKRIQGQAGRLRPYKGITDPKNEKFRKRNKNALAGIRANCKSLIARYPDTAAAKEAKALMAKYE
ncbi:hypothetical protein ACFL01_04565 [Planctomycetota bacterium]